MTTPDISNRVDIPLAPKFDGVTLTAAAAAKVKALIESEGDPELSLRIAVKRSGCSGYAYDMFSTPLSIQAMLSLRSTMFEFSSMVEASRWSTERSSTSRTTASQAPASPSTIRTPLDPVAAARAFHRRRPPFKGDNRGEPATM